MAPSNGPLTGPALPGAIVPSRPGAWRGRLLGYGALRLLVEALLALRGIVLAQLLGAGAFGAWALFRILLNYGALAGLGCLTGLEKRAAAADPNGQERDADARTAVGFALLVFGPVSLLALCAAGLVAEPGMAAALSGVALCLLAERLWFYGIVYLRSTGAFGRFATVELGSAVVNLVLVLALAALFGLPGAIFGFLAGYLAGLFGTARHVPLRPALEPQRLRALLQIGLPLSLGYFLTLLTTSIDRLVLLAYTDLATLGLYAFAAAVGNLAAAMGSVVRTLVFPRLYRHAAEVGAAAGTAEHLRTTLLPFVWLVGPLVTLGAAGLPLATAVLAPGFAVAVPAAAVFLVGGVAAGLAQLATLGVVAAGRQWVTPWLTATALALNLGAALLVLQAGLGLAALAAATVSVRILHAAALVVLLDLGHRHRAGAALALFLPLVWCAGLAGAVAATGPSADLAGLGRAVIVTLAGLSPLAFPAWRVVRAATRPAGA